VEWSNAVTPPHDPVDHPRHYNSHPARCVCGAGIECIQIVEHMTFNLGNAVKYLWRHDSKGNPLEDLRKAIWYVQREITRLEAMEKRDENPVRQ
jgi:hypothetical protein